MELNKNLKISKRARRAVALVLLSLAAFIAFYDCSENVIFKNKLASRILSSSEEQDAHKIKEQITHHVINNGGFQIVLPSVIDETP